MELAITNGSVHEMTKERFVQTSIRVPESKYEILEEIKKIEDTSISALVLEGIDKIIIERKDELISRMKKRSDLIHETLDKIE